VYAKTLKLHKGSDSRLQFQFVNQDQKPVNITGKEITFRLISYDNSKILLQQSLTNTLPLTGIAELRVHMDSLSKIVPQKCYYSIELPDDIGLNIPGFMDKNSTGRGDIQIVDSIFPKYIPTQQLSVIKGGPGAPATYYSSKLTTQYNPKITMQVIYDGYNGNVTLQGSTNGTSDWYDIDSMTYNDIDYPESGSQVYTINGYHPYIQIKFDSTIGNITNILAR
jgi:hypothetical protein